MECIAKPRGRDIVMCKVVAEVASIGERDGIAIGIAVELHRFDSWSLAELTRCGRCVEACLCL
jgi:hypothetical protein